VELAFVDGNLSLFFFFIDITSNLVFGMVFNNNTILIIMIGGEQGRVEIVLLRRYVCDVIITKFRENVMMAEVMQCLHDLQYLPYHK
jgi:hypothetical protein